MKNTILMKISLFLVCFLCMSMNYSSINRVDLEDTISSDIQILRNQHDLPDLIVLKKTDKLEKLIQRRVARVVQHGKDFHHQNAEIDFRDFAENMDYISFAENVDILLNQSTLNPVERWMNSETHKKNIINPKFTHTYVAVYENTQTNNIIYVQIFLKFKKPNNG